MNSEHHNHDDHEVVSLGGPKEYFKFALVIIGIVAAAFLISADNELMALSRTFMGIYMLTFGFFKLIDLKMFAVSYREYDILTKLVPWWGYVYPFVEIGIGAALLLGFGLLPVFVLLLGLMSFNAAGVVNELVQKNKIRCACLGKFVNLPITTITLAEDLLMASMAAVMILST